MKTIVYDVDAEKLINRLAEALKEKKEIKQPEWAYFVKTSSSKQRPPSESNFWHVRAASIMRHLYIKNVVGVNRLRVKYGGLKKRGVRPAKFARASGKIIRTILQQLEKAGLVEKTKEKKSGRKLTASGKKIIEEAAEKSAGKK